TNVSKLDGCGPKCCNARTAVFGVSTEIDQHFDVLGVDDTGSVEVADVAQIDESVCADLDLFPDLGAVVRPYAVSENFKAVTIVHPEQRVGKVRIQMFSKVRRQVTDPDPVASAPVIETHARLGNRGGVAVCYNRRDTQWHVGRQWHG